MGVTGGAPKPASSASMELAMEVVTRFSNFITLLFSHYTSLCLNLSFNTISRNRFTFVALQHQVNLLQSQVETLATQPSSLQRATEIRKVNFQEELLKLFSRRAFETTVDLQRQALESLGVQAQHYV
ncbi:uncharacterized protein [Apostichopus japonicus]|uniref:uncharacterized protein n=1 Tax=Stichopus japonicus TaxID=307972 RepID=UPI003AB1567A